LDITNLTQIVMSDASKMYCIECGNRLPDLRNDSTVCSKCKTPLATWWDETSQTYRTNRESILPFATPPYGDKSIMSQRKNTQTIEERCFQAALIGLEIRYDEAAWFGLNSLPTSWPEIKKMITNTLDKSLHKSDVRYG
jgi:palmitoyltransferase